MNKYKVFYPGGNAVIEAENLYDAKKKTVSDFAVPASKWGLVAIVLIERADGTEVTFNPASL